jgi:hypothetical protein
MAQEVQRVRYFNGEFLDERDFNGEQAYHIRMRYLHNRWLHTFGIAHGLEVTQGPGALQVTVKPGLALVKVIENRIEQFQGEEVAKEVMRISPNVLTLSGAGVGDILVVISYEEVAENNQTAENTQTRWTERPSLRPQLASATPAPDNESVLILARVTLNAARDGIASVSTADRRNAGLRGDVEATEIRLPFGNQSAQWPRLKAGAASRLDLTGSLAVSGNIDLQPNARVDGRDVSQDGATLDGHLVDADRHVTNGDDHDHTNGHGKPIPWSAVKNLPDIFVRAYATILTPAPPNPPTLGSRRLRVTSVARSAGGTAGSYDISFDPTDDPIFILTIQGVSPETFTAHVVNFSSNSASVVVKRSNGTPIDPTKLFFVVL